MKNNMILKTIGLTAALGMLGFCGKPSVYVLNNTGDSHNGKDGTNGSNGLGMVFSQISADSLSCPNGGTILMVALDANSNGILDTDDTNIMSSTLCNGLSGTNGRDGTDGTDGTTSTPSPYSIVELLNPCGDAVGIYDEVLIKLLNGTVLASFSDNANGNNTRFSVIPAGTYKTTDGDNCTFSLNSLGQITYQSH